MRSANTTELRFGFTTGACATAAAKASAIGLATGTVPAQVEITLPRGQRVTFDVVESQVSDARDEAVATIQKDAGDDPDVTHGAMIVVALKRAAAGSGIVFARGDGVGVVTKPGLPISPGEPAINPVPRQMISTALGDVAAAYGWSPDFHVTVSIPGGADIAKATWNPRLGIEGGLSILGTTGIVRPFSCAAWIASIHRGIDVARANGITHAVGSTGATSERVAQARFGLPDHAMLDMGDFAGGLLKYLNRHPIDRLTIAGGFGKLTKLAQGHLDLHSSRSQVDFGRLAAWAEPKHHNSVADANTAQHALTIAGPALAATVAHHARETAARVVADAGTRIDVLVVDRAGTGVAAADDGGGHVL